MIIGNLFGGLGNQMFQYAFIRCLSIESNENFGFTIDMIKFYRNNNNYELKNAFNLDLNILNEKQINEVKNELTVKPFVNSDYGKEEEPFKVYLENEGKLYIPRSYGVEKFGAPELSLLPSGKDININFNLNLKE